MSMTVRQFIEVKLNNERLIRDIVRAREPENSKTTSSLIYSDVRKMDQWGIRNRSAMVTALRIDNEIKLKRTLLDMHKPSRTMGEGFCQCSYSDNECYALLSIAAVWSDSPHFNPEWSLD